MNNKILCDLPICVNPTNKGSNKGEERIQQYIEGFNIFFEHISVLQKYNIDIIIFDNTVDRNERLPQNLLNIIPSNVKIIHDNVNIYGSVIIFLCGILRYSFEDSI